MMTVKQLNLRVEGLVVRSFAAEERRILGFDLGRRMWFRYPDGQSCASIVVRGCMEVEVHGSSLRWHKGLSWRESYSGEVEYDPEGHE